MLSYNIFIGRDFMTTPRTLRVFTAFLLAVASWGCHANPDFRILASIRPLQLMATDLVTLAGLEAEVSVETLLQPGMSPHHLSLKASDLSRLHSADLVVWVGPELEYFLVSALANQFDGISLQLDGEGEKTDSTQGHHGGDHDHQGEDRHLWLDPEFAADAISRLSAALISALPQHRSDLERAETEYRKRLQTLSISINDRFRQLNTSAGVVVYHDSLGYFLKAYGITQVAALTRVPEEQIGLRSLMALRRHQPACLLADLGELPTADAYGKRLGWPVVGYDLLAQDTEIGNYVDYLRAIESAIVSCFATNVVE